MARLPLFALPMLVAIARPHGRALPLGEKMRLCDGGCPNARTPARGAGGHAAVPLHAAAFLIPALKLELARRFPRDREAYIEGKTAFVRGVVAEVLAAGQNARDNP